MNYPGGVPYYPYYHHRHYHYASGYYYHSGLIEFCILAAMVVGCVLIIQPWRRS